MRLSTEHESQKDFQQSPQERNASLNAKRQHQSSFKANKLGVFFHFVRAKLDSHDKLYFSA